MRRLLLSLPLLVPICAHAQSQAANPVSPFSEGRRVGTSSNPLFAALSSVVPSASAASGQAASPVELFSYGQRVGTQGNPIYINLGNALVPYLTQTQSAATYLPLAALAQPVTFGSSITANGDVTANGNVTASKNVSVKGNVFVAGVLTNSAAYNASQTWTGQGFGIQWNLAAGGIGATEFINVNPGVRGGFNFYDITTGTTISSGARPLLSMSWSGGTVFGGLTGTGNAYACLDTNGKLYRSASACQ